MSHPKLKVFKIPNMNVIVIKQTGTKFFVATKDSIVIDIFGLASILKFLLFTGILNRKVLEGILEEYDSYDKDRSDW